MNNSHGRSAWSKEQIVALLDREDFAYQDIELPYGLRTGGHNRMVTANDIFPQDMTGKTVLDLGCSFGFFCFEALRRGATRVVGYDVDPDCIRKAKLLAECMGVEAEFAVRDVELEPLEEKFDYVLCLNLLHHLKNPISVLDNIIESTRERLALETASFGRYDRRKVSISWLTQKLLERLPIIFVSQNGTRGSRQLQKFFITPWALEHLLIYHRGMFARLKQKRSEHKGRHITVADKRQIGHLLVVSGPTSAGKKTLMRKLLANELPALAERLGTADSSIWGEPFNAQKNFIPTEPVREHMILHQDFMRPFLRSAISHERDEGNDILGTARRITFITVWAEPDKLAKQITKAEIEPFQARGKKPRRHLRIREVYEDGDKVLEHYERWFAFTEGKSTDHIVVSPHDGFSMHSIEEWRDLVSRRQESR